MLLHPIDHDLDRHIPLLLVSEDLVVVGGGKATTSHYFVLYRALKMQSQALGQARVVAGSNAK